MKVKDLREIAKFQGLRGYSRLKKSDLIYMIESYDKGIEKCDIEVLVKHRLACYVRTERRVPCTWPRIPVFRSVFRRIISTEVIPFLWFLWIKIILQTSRENLLR